MTDAKNAAHSAKQSFEIFLAAAPGTENWLAEEARYKRFKSAKAVPGGVTLQGGWPDVWRANLEIRGASRILARIESFRVLHLAELDKRARRVDWGKILRADQPFTVEATCKKSKIYHSGAAAERIQRAITEELGAKHDDNALVTVRARIEGDLCTLAVDTSGELLHKRGFKEAVNAAPMRETMAAMFLRACSYNGREPVLDPMCGSGTFVIEAAEIAAGLHPGRSRSFAFEKLATFDAKAWKAMRATPPDAKSDLTFIGSDRDPGAIRMSIENAKRAGVGERTHFEQLTISDLMRPDGPPGLVILNPPYGDRIGDKKKLTSLYRALGSTLKERFKGWRVGLITSETPLAHATGITFTQISAPIAHGGLRVKLFQTDALT